MARECGAAATQVQTRQLPVSTPFIGTGDGIYSVGHILARIHKAQYVLTP